ncbi:MAG: hypothetical protein GY938_27225 [Ketobacter sp.]|nr:hypothetical protein [Ketobacter sp.]
MNLTKQFLPSQFDGTPKQKAYKARWANYHRREIVKWQEMGDDFVQFVNEAKGSIEKLLPPVIHGSQLIEENLEIGEYEMAGTR